MRSIKYIQIKTNNQSFIKEKTSSSFQLTLITIGKNERNNSLSVVFMANPISFLFCSLINFTDNFIL